MTTDSDSAKKGVNPFVKKSGDYKKSSGGFVGAIKDRDALKNALKTYAKMPAGLQPSRKAAIIKAAKAIGAEFMLPKDWAMADTASLAGLHTCNACERTFVDLAILADHAEALHSFDETREIVRNALSKQFGAPSVTPLGTPQHAMYVWVAELASDWVVFEVDTPAPGSSTKLMKATYTIADDGAVTFGTPKEVVRRTVYDTVKPPASAS